MEILKLSLYLVILGVAIAVLAKLLLLNQRWRFNFKQTVLVLVGCLGLLISLYAMVGSWQQVNLYNFLTNNQQELTGALKLWESKPLVVIKILETKLQQNSTDKTLRRLLAGLYLRTEQYALANKVMLPISQDQSIDIQLLMAEIYYHQGEFNKSKAKLHGIVQTNQVTYTTLWIVSRLAVLIKDKQLALKALRLARKQLVVRQMSTVEIDQALDEVLQL